MKFLPGRQAGKFDYRFSALKFSALNSAVVFVVILPSCGGTIPSIIKPSHFGAGVVLEQV